MGDLGEAHAALVTPDLAPAPPAPGTAREATAYELALHRTGVVDGGLDMLDTIEAWAACARARETNLDELDELIEENRSAFTTMRGHSVPETKPRTRRMAALALGLERLQHLAAKRALEASEQDVRKLRGLLNEANERLDGVGQRPLELP